LKRNEPGFSARALARVLRDHLSGSVAVKIAYSGGADSHVLLHALCELRDSSPWAVSAIHVNHGLHPQAAAWADHCLAVCERYGLACAVEHLKVRAIGTEGLEAAARRLRYATLARHIGPGEALLTAHHLNDQAETVLLQLLRGAGVRGLAGMRAVVDFSNGKLVRPLLEFTRAELLTYAQQQELRWIEDTSNRDLGRSRNFIRHQVLPLLEQRWPQAKRVIARAARHAAEASALLDLVASTDLLSLPRAAAPTECYSLLDTPAQIRHAANAFVRANCATCRAVIAVTTRSYHLARWRSAALSGRPLDHAAKTKHRCRDRPDLESRRATESPWNRLRPLS
jgi:tRNA(Ile)-lysidine synthetase-like protein